MSLRLQRLATDWKTYAGVIAGAVAGLSLATELLDKLAKAVAGVANLPPKIKWLAAGLLAALSLLALLSALGRRSALLRPERFVISADDPEHLVGRDEEVKALAKACEQNALVFLQGESGAGKSALVLGGLLPHYQASRAESEAPRLLPIRIDASALAWDNGLRIELARALRDVSAAEQARLGASAGFGSGDPFSWIAALPVDAPCQVLLVLDQIDDYAVAHQARFVRGHTVVAPEQFEETNADWAAMGSVVRKGSIRLLIVCRADAAGILEALRFTRARTFLLPRIDQQLISPILDHVTQADEGAPVVADPEHGWLQLKAQLLRDLAAGGNQILPVQLAIALDSLRRFRFLTPSEYARNGGVRGLERLHIERHLHEAARAAGLAPDALLRGLVCLVAENGLKTKRATVPEFAQAIGVTEPGAAALEIVVEHLMRWRILRRQSAAEGEYLLLHHDYLARGVREVQRQANYWVELLRERTRELEEAFGWRQRWRALLPLVAQARLFWARLRRRFHYGEHRRLAFWSMLRILPVAAAVAGVIGFGWLLVQSDQELLAERVVARIGSSPWVSGGEAELWRQLADAGWSARLHAVRLAVFDYSIAERAVKRAELLTHAAVGLDPTGELSWQLLREAILPDLHEGSSSLRAASGAIGLHLRLARPEATALARALAKRMEREQSYFPLGNLRDEELAALSELSDKLEARDVLRVAAPLVKLIETEENSFALSMLGRALAALSANLEANVVQRIAAALVKRMETEQDSPDLLDLGEALAALSDRLEAQDARRGAVVLLKRIETEEDSFSVLRLGEALAGLTANLEANVVQPVAAALLKRIETERSERALSDLGRALAALSANLEANVVQWIAAALVKRIQTEQKPDVLLTLHFLLAELSGKRDAIDVKAGARGFAKQVATAQGSDTLVRLGQTLAGLNGNLEARDGEPLAAALVKRMKTDQDPGALHYLRWAVAGLSGKLEAKDAQPLAAALVKRMETEQNSDALSYVGTALAALSVKLEAKDAQPLAAALVKRMEAEQNAFALSGLGAALAVLSEKLNARDVKRGAAALAHAIKNADDLERLTEAWRELEHVAYADLDLQKRIQAYVDLLRLPLVVGDARKTLLDGLEKLTGEKFEGDLWRFVDWATESDEGKELRLDLGGP